MLSVLCMYTCKVYSIHQRARRCLLINVSGHRHVFFQGFTPQFPPPPSRWPVRLGDQQSFQSQLASQSHHLFVIPVIVVGKRPLLPCSAAAAGMWRAAARLAADGRLLWSERLYNYTYMKNCAEYHTNVYVCSYWMAIVTPLFEATDRPGVPTSSVLRRNSTVCHNRDNTFIKSRVVVYHTSKIKRDISKTFHFI